MRGFFRNLLAAIRGRRAQATLGSIVSSVQNHVDALAISRQHIYNETYANDDRIAEIRRRNTALFDDAGRSIRLESKLRDFVS